MKYQPAVFEGIERIQFTFNPPEKGTQAVLFLQFSNWNFKDHRLQSTNNIRLLRTPSVNKIVYTYKEDISTEFTQLPCITQTPQLSASFYLILYPLEQIGIVRCISSIQEDHTFEYTTITISYYGDHKGAEDMRQNLVNTLKIEYQG